MSSPLMKAENLDFNSQGVDEIRKRVFNIWWNVFAFYKIYATKLQRHDFPLSTDIVHVMDRWIVSKVTNLTINVTKSMNSYDIATASRLIIDFVNELSTHYLRESRERLRSEDKASQAVQIFGAVLKRLSLLAAPIVPFFTEVVYQNLVADPKDSIHLEDWPTADKKYINLKLEEEIALMYQIAEKTHSLRKKAGIKLRQPLSVLYVKGSKKLGEAVTEVLKQEVNVEKVSWANSKSSSISVKLDTTITEELKQKGEVREIIRMIQNLRKEAGVKFDEMVNIQLKSWPEKYEKQIKIKTFVSDFVKGDEEKLITI